MNKYESNLLPDQSRFENKNEHKVLRTLSYIFAISFFIFSMAFMFTRFWQGLLFLVVGLIILPNVHNMIERKLRFKFKTLPKTVACIILVLSAFVIGHHYEKEEIKKAEIEKEKERLVKEEAERIEKARIDSLSMFQNSSIQLINENKLKDAYSLIQIALSLSKTENEKNKSNFIKADYLLKSSKNTDAITELTALINSNYNLSETYYKRAICYQKAKLIQEAVNDLREAIKLGNTDANKLHEKINPIKKKIIGYTTLCCDGTTSSAKGRGACSHHGGVCDWNHPIYQEYRKY